MKVHTVKGGLNTVAAAVAALAMMFLYAAFDGYKETGSIDTVAIAVGILLIAVAFWLYHWRELYKIQTVLEAFEEDDDDDAEDNGKVIWLPSDEIQEEEEDKEEEEDGDLGEQERSD